MQMSNDSDLELGSPEGLSERPFLPGIDVQHFPGSCFCPLVDDGDSWA